MKQQPTVLVIEENSNLSDTFSLILKKRGYNVETTREACTAVTKPDTSRFDVILMDVIKPGTNSIETLHKIKDLAPGGKVILLASHYNEAELREILVEQAFQTVYKPVDIGQLMALIKATIENQPLPGQDNSIHIDQ